MPQVNYCVPSSVLLYYTSAFTEMHKLSICVVLESAWRIPRVTVFTALFPAPERARFCEFVVVWV